MFAVHIRQLYRISDKVICRTLRAGRLGPNPGLDCRIKAFESEGHQVKDDNTEEFVEQSESDFYNLGEAYNEHMNETLMGKYETRHRIVKEKYFKENMPSLLTWSEKEQIRHLANEDPEEWTPERIAESFPVTVPVVKKLLKYPWKPASEFRIARHDASVMRNWKELKEGSLDIPPHLRNHFLKFTNRDIPPLKKESIKIELKQKEEYGEFESIVRRCAEKDNQGMAKEEEPTNVKQSLALPIPNTESENEPIKAKVGKKDPKRVTLEELATKIKTRLEKGRNVDIGDTIMINSMNTVDVKKSEDISKEIELFNQNLDRNSVIEFKEKEETPKDVMAYPERIRIPKKAYKKGATYKVDDCYYDHDGRFLYRVLGFNN